MKKYFTIRILFSNLFLMSLAISQSQLSLKNDNIQIIKLDATNKNEVEAFCS